MCLGTLSASVLPRGSSGWHAQPLLPPESQLDICGYFYLSFSIIGLTQSSQCVGETPDGEDFKSFVGVEKTLEIKVLFSSWIHKIYHKI